MAVNAVASLLLTMHMGVYGAVVGSVVGTLTGAVVLVVLSRHRLSSWIRPAWAAPLVSMTVVVVVLVTGLDRVGSWLLLILAVVLFAAVTTVAAARAERVAMADLRRVLRRLPR